jgi:hypothetical protein
MRAILILAVLVVVGILVGWITIGREPGRASINLETQEVREDTKEAMHSGAELLHKAGDDVEAAADATPDRDEREPGAR